MTTVLKEHRRKQGISIVQVAKRIDLDWRVIYNMEVTGIFYKTKKEERGFNNVCDLAFALDGEVKFWLTDFGERRYDGKDARLMRLERKLGMRPRLWEGHKKRDHGKRGRKGCRN